MASQPIRACLIINPRSGRDSIDLSEALLVLRAHGWEVDVRQKMHGGQAAKLARSAARDGCSVVVNCGGDGTLSEIVDGLVGTDVSVGVLPGGTVNLWAAELGVSPRLRVAAYQLVGAERRRVDVGQVRINGRHGQHFLLMAGLGLDGSIMARVSKPLKNRLGKLAIGLAALRAMPTFATVPLRVEMDGVHWYGSAYQIVVGNTRRYGGFTSITPGAYADDGLLDVCLFGAVGPAGAARQLASLWIRGHPDSATAETYRARSIVVRAPSAMPLQIDGGAAPFREDSTTDAGCEYAFTVAPRAVTILAPRVYDGELFQQRTLADAEIPAPPAQHGHGRHDGDQGVYHGERIRVDSVAMDSFTGVQVKGGQTVTVLFQPDTVLQNGGRASNGHVDTLSDLQAGDIVRVKGEAGTDASTVTARKIRLIAHPVDD